MNSSKLIIKTIQDSSGNFNWQELLESIISAFDCTTGTLHTLDSETNLLILRSQLGIPDFLLPKMTSIPIGKGMAGIAAERKTPVEMCNLQTDSSGVARPGAKKTKVEGSIAVPMLLEGKVYGTLGIAKSIPYDFSKSEIETLLSIGGEIAKSIRS